MTVKSYRRRQRTLLTNVLFYACRLCPIVLCLLTFQFRWKLNVLDHRVQSTTQEAAPETSSEVMHSITLWNVNALGCRGTFTQRESTQGIPQFMIRDVVVDNRQSMSMYRRKNYENKTFRGVIVFVSVTPPGTGPRFKMTPISPTHPCPNIRTDLGPSARVLTGNTPEKSLAVSIDAIYQSPSSDNASCGSLKRDFREADEWQILMTISFNGELNGKNDPVDMMADETLSRLERSNSEIVLQVPFATSANTYTTFNASFGLACVTGLTRTTKLPAFTDSIINGRQGNCHAGTGAVMVAGGALWGSLASKEGYKTVGSFVARSLLGHLRFDAVALGVTVKHTVAEIQHICQADEACASAYHDANEMHIRRIALGLEHSLRDMGVPSALLERVILFPFCRLGADYDGAERRVPCIWSRYRGQENYGYLSYALVAPYFKWAVSFDVDESIVDLVASSAGGASKSGAWGRSAAARFDGCGRTEFPGALWFRWADFKRGNDTAMEQYTGMMRQGVVPRFKTPEGVIVNISKCFDHKMGVANGGKVALACWLGFGFRVHRGVVMDDYSDINSIRYTPGGRWDNRNAMVTSLVLLHGRDQPRFGSCVLDVS